MGIVTRIAHLRDVGLAFKTAGMDALCDVQRPKSSWFLGNGRDSEFHEVISTCVLTFPFRRGVRERRPKPVARRCR